METLRRCALGLGICAAAWLWFAVDLSPRIVLESVGPGERQPDGMASVAAPPDLRPLLERVDRAGRGEGPESGRCPPGSRIGDRPGPVFFRADEEDVQPVLRLIPPGEWVRLRLRGGGRPLQVDAGHWRGTDDDFLLGAGFQGREPPPASFRPLRRYAPWVALAALLVYLLLPRRRREPGMLGVATTRIILGDLLGAGLLGFFFALPLFVVGASQVAVRSYWMLPAVFWALALFGVWILVGNGIAATFGLRVDEQGVHVARGRSVETFPFETIASFGPAIRRSPRWVGALTLLALLAGRGQAAGPALLAGASGGLALHLRDGRTVLLWAGAPSGGITIPGAATLPEALAAKGVATCSEPVERRTLSAALAQILPARRRA